MVSTGLNFTGKLFRRRVGDHRRNGESNCWLGVPLHDSANQGSTLTENPRFQAICFPGLLSTLVLI